MADGLVHFVCEQLTPELLSGVTVLELPSDDPERRPSFVNDIEFMLPTGQGFENNANFGFAIVGAFDPDYVGSDGAVGFVSSVAGTNSSDTTNGYNRLLVSGGSMRLDMVTVSAVPEPGSLSILATGVAILVAFRRRNHCCPKSHS